MHAVAIPGRWAWGLTGLVTAAALAVPATWLITTAGAHGPWAGASSVTVRTVTVTQPVTSLLVKSGGGQVQVTAGQVSDVQVTERIVYGPAAGGPPAVGESVTGGRLSLSDPACVNCSVDFTVTVPSAVSVTVDTEGGPAMVSGVSGVSGSAGTTVDSGGGPARITQVTGPLTVTTDGGPLIMNEVAGPLRADSGGGTLAAHAVTAATATFSTAGGPAQIAFSAAPDSVRLDTGGGPANLRVPGGPYRLSADSGGGPELIGIATDPAARPAIRVTSDGGPILVGSASTSASGAAG